MKAQKRLLLLKDYLELDPNSDSSNSFAAYPRRAREYPTTTVRCLLEADSGGGGGARLARSRSRAALARISAVLNAVAISKKFIAASFRKKKKEAKSVDIVPLNSFELYGPPRRSSAYLPSPVVSSCGSFSDAGEASQPRGREKQEEQECRSAEEEQLSPVSVMDFPCRDEDDDEEGDDNDDEDVGSRCFEQGLANIERTTHQLLQKIRRFETLAELDPPEFEDDEDAHVATSSDEVTAGNLIERLVRADCGGAGPHAERLLADFLREGGLPRSAGVEGLVARSRDWIDGGGGGACPEEHDKAELAEMERTGRWRGFEGGRDDVAADVESGVLRSLLHELVLEMAPVIGL